MKPSQSRRLGRAILIATPIAAALTVVTIVLWEPLLRCLVMFAVMCAALLIAIVVGGGWVERS